MLEECLRTHLFVLLLVLYEHQNQFEEHLIYPSFVGLSKDAYMLSTYRFYFVVLGTHRFVNLFQISS